DIGFTEIANHPGLRKLASQLFGTVLRTDPQRKLRSALARISRSLNQTESLRKSVELRFKIRGQRITLFPERGHRRFIENFHRSPERRHLKNRRVTELPSFGTGNGFKNRAHLETRGFALSPPPCKAREIARMSMSLMNKTSAKRSRSAIEVFVAA